MMILENKKLNRVIFRSRRGITILMVVIVGMTLMAMVVMLLSGGSDSREKVFQMKEKYQSMFLAKGGQQHALLKFRLLPTPFYDAAAYAIGKNPYYDFTRKMDRYNNPGPMFFTGDVQAPTIGTGNGQEMLIVSRTGEWALTPADKTFKGVMSTHLNRFLKDIRSEYPVGGTNEAVVTINSETHDDQAMGPNWHDPYSGNYHVDRVFIFGSQGALNYSTDSVMISCKGAANRANQKSIVYADSSGQPKNLTRIFQKYTSKAQAGSGFDDQIDTVSNMDKFESLQADFEKGLTEGVQRGEAVTSVYEVRREK